MAQRLLGRVMTGADAKPYRGRLRMMAESLDALDDRALGLQAVEPALVWRVPDDGG